MCNNLDATIAIYLELINYVQVSGFSVKFSENLLETLKVRQIRNDFFKPMFLPKNERTKGLVKVGPGFPAPVPFWVPKG